MLPLNIFRCLPKEWLTPHALESSLESRQNNIAPEEASTATTESTLTEASVTSATPVRQGSRLSGLARSLGIGSGSNGSSNNVQQSDKQS